MFLKPHSSSGVPIYLQLMDQVKHAIETGALQPGDQLPGLRTLADSLVMNPNTVAKSYRELEHEGIIEIRHGSGAFVAKGPGVGNRTRQMAIAQTLLRQVIEKLTALELSEEEARRMFESELTRKREQKR